MRRAALAAIALLAAGCGLSPRPEVERAVTITEPVTLGLGNFTVVRVVPDVRDVYVVWRGYHLQSGSALRVPYETLRLAADHEEYLVTDRGTGNDALKVNGVLHEFDASRERLVIRFGEGVAVEPGGDHAAAATIHEGLGE